MLRDPSLPPHGGTGAREKERYTIHNFSCFTIFYHVYFKKAFHTKVRASNRIGPHNKEVISVLIGSLLGDSYASGRTIEGTRFSYRQSKQHKDYLFLLYEFLTVEVTVLT